MKDKESFMESWAQQRQSGKQKYILTQAIRAASTALAGVVVASIFLYNSPSTYAVTDYLPTYLIIFFGVHFAATLKYKHKWGRNEEKYSQLMNNQ